MKILGFASKKTSIRKKIVLSISCVAILMAFYCVAFSYWLTTSKVEDMSRRLSENNLHSAGKLVDNYLNLFENYTTQIVRIPDLQKINESGRFPLDDTLNTDSIHSAVRTYLSMAESDGIKFGECAIYLKNGYSYIYSNQPNPFYNDYESCLLYFQKQGFDDFQYNQAEWISNTTLYNENGEETIGLINVRFFYNSITMEKTGIIVSTLYEDNLREVYSGFAENAFILSKKGIVLSSAEKNKIAALYPNETIRLSILNSSGNGTLTYKKNWYQNPEMVSFRAVMNNDAYLVVPFDFYTVMTRKEMVEYIRSSLFPMSAGVLIAFLLAFLFSDRLSKSIVTLTTFVKHIEEGHNKGRIHLEGRDEVAYLGEKINDMLNRIQESEMNREQELKTKQMLELQLLQSQINPHLLYNTLDSVFWRLKKKNTDDAETLLVSLSEFFKKSLAQGKTETTLREELQLIQNYLVIQRLAREKQFRLIDEIPSNLSHHPVMKLSLQTIVENAIIHGFEGYREDGVIKIDAKREESNLVITVEDNGIGMLPSEIDEQNQLLNTYPPPADMRSYGLYNINRRIIQSYGSGYGIVLSSRVSEYTRVTMKMPFIDIHKLNKCKEENECEQ